MHGFRIKFLLTFLMIFVCHGACAAFPLVFKQSAEHQEYNPVAAQILAKAYQQAGYRIKPSKKENISHDGFLISQRDARKEYGDYIRIPVAIVKVRLLAYTQQRNEGTRYEYGLLGNRVAVVKGSRFAERYMEGLVSHQSDSAEGAFNRLRKNRVDIVLIPELEAMSARNKVKGVVALSPAVKEVTMYHYVHKKHKHIVPKIKRALAKMERKDQISGIQRSYQQVLKSS